LFDASARGNPLEFLDETYLTKTRDVRLPFGKNFIILTSTVFVGFTHVTDGWAIAYSALSIYAKCCCALKMEIKNGRSGVTIND